MSSQDWSEDLDEGNEVRILMILTDMRRGVMVVMMTLKWEELMWERVVLHM